MTGGRVEKVESKREYGDVYDITSFCVAWRKGHVVLGRACIMAFDVAYPRCKISNNWKESTRLPNCSSH